MGKRGAFEDFNFNRVSGGVYQGAVDGNGTGGFDEILWTFASPIVGLAADWSSTAEAEGVLGIAGDFDGTGEIAFRPVDSLGGDGTGFFGIVGTAHFSSVRLIISPTGSGNNEQFTVDNLSFAVAQAHQVPAPGTLPLGGLALAALGALHGRARNR